MNSASIVNLIGDDLDVTEAVILDHIMAILYVGWHSAGEVLKEEEAQACIEHFSPYVEWRGMAVKQEFQALTLAEGQEEIRAHEVRSQKTIQGCGRPRVAKPPASMAETVPMGMDCSPWDFKKRPRVRNGQGITDQTQQLPRWIKTILHQVDSFQGGLWDFHRTGIPVSLGIILRTVTSILFQ